MPIKPLWKMRMGQSTLTLIHTLECRESLIQMLEVLKQNLMKRMIRGNDIKL